MRAILNSLEASKVYISSRVAKNKRLPAKLNYELKRKNDISLSKSKFCNISGRWADESPGINRLLFLPIN